MGVFSIAIRTHSSTLEPIETLPFSARTVNSHTLNGDNYNSFDGSSRALATLRLNRAGSARLQSQM